METFRKFKLRKPSKILAFSIKSLLKNNQTETNIQPKHLSKGYYFGHYQDGFRVLPDGKTVIGLHKDQQNVLIEDITNKQSLKFVGKSPGVIYAMIYDKNTSCIIIGNIFSKIIFFDLKKGRSFGANLQGQTKVHINSMISMASFRNLLVLADLKNKIVIFDKYSK